MAKKQFLEEMTLEEAKAWRASLVKNEPKQMNDKEKRAAFKIYWAQNKKKFGMTNKLEEILWLHLVSTKNDSPEKFETGLKNFGLKV